MLMLLVEETLHSCQDSRPVLSGGNAARAQMTAIDAIHFFRGRIKEREKKTGEVNFEGRCHLTQYVQNITISLWSQ